MSKNASIKRRNRHRHKNQFSRFPLGKTDLGVLVSKIEPQSTPLLEMLRRANG